MYAAAVLCRGLKHALVGSPFAFQPSQHEAEWLCDLNRKGTIPNHVDGC